MGGTRKPVPESTRRRSTSSNARSRRPYRQVADGLGATPSQVAIAWIRTRSPSIHPIIGARRGDQLVDNLGAVDIDLPADATERHETAAPIDLGFPTSFINETSAWVFGAASLPGD